MIPQRALALLQALADSVADAVRDSTGGAHHVFEVAVREALTFALAAVSSLLLLDLPFAQLLFLSTLADLLTTPWDAQRWVGLRALPSRVVKEFGGRLVVNAAIIFVLVTLANALPRLFGYLIEVSVAAAAVRSGTGTLDHLLPAGHPFRRTWGGIVARVEALWNVDDPTSGVDLPITDADDAPRPARPGARPVGDSPEAR